MLIFLIPLFCIVYIIIKLEKINGNKIKCINLYLLTLKGVLDTTEKFLKVSHQIIFS